MRQLQMLLCVRFCYDKTGAGEKKKFQFGRVSTNGYFWWERKLIFRFNIVLNFAELKAKLPLDEISIKFDLGHA